MTRAGVATLALAVTLLGYAASPGGVAGQEGPENGLTVTHRGGGTVDASPGGRATAVFLVTNPGSQPLQARVIVRAPEGWPVLEPASLTIPPRGSSLRLVGFSVPTAAPAGDYALHLEAAAGDATAADSIVVRVGALPGLEAAVESAPSWAVAGDSFEITFVVHNTGNVPLPLELALSCAGDVTAMVTEGPGALAPGESARVVARAQVAADLSRSGGATVRLRASAASISADAAAPVEVFPAGQGMVTQRARIPGEVRARLGNDPRAGSPLRLALAGPIAPGSGTRIDLLLAAPAEGGALSGESDLYRLRVDSRRYAVRLGDDLFRLSPLTEPGRTGTGGSLRLRAGPFELGGYMQENRRLADAAPQIAGFLAAALPAGATTQLNWLRSEENGALRQVWSGETRLALPGWGTLRGEYGLRPANGGGARSIAADIDRGGFALEARHVSTDTAFGGGQAGWRSDAVSLSFRPSGDLVLRAAVDWNHAQELEHTRSRSGSRNARVTAGWGSALTVDLVERARSTGVGDREVRRVERSVQGRGSIALGPFRIQPTAEWGRVLAGGQGADAFMRGRLEGELAGSSGALSGSIEYREGPTVHDAEPEQRLAAAVAGRLDFRTGTRIELSAQRVLDHGRITHSGASGRLSQRFAGDHVLSLRVATGTRSATPARGEPLLSLEYALPFALPGLAADRQPSGSAMVRIFDAENGAPIPRVLVRLGAVTRATDSEGIARFSAVAPGTHVMVLDRSSAGADRTPMTRLPLPVEIRVGEQTSVELPLARAGSLVARVQVARAASVAAAARGEQGEPEALAGAAVEFVRAGERVRRLTDSAGLVRLSDLAPGRWTVTVDRAAAPSRHRFTQETLAIDVPAGGAVEVGFLAVPRERRVTMVASSAIGDAAPRARAFVVSEREPTLRDVARGVYRDETLWPKLWLANCAHVSDPEHVRPGQVLTIPSAGALSARERDLIRPGGFGRQCAEGAASSPSIAPGRAGHRLTGTLLNLRELAATVYGDASLWPKIWFANRAEIPDPEQIRAGQVLSIPARAPLTDHERAALEDYRRRRDRAEPGAPRP